MTARHANNFDALRLVAATMVIVHHTSTFHLLPELGSLQPVADFNFGFVGVATFFIISGYLIMMSWDRNPAVWRFLWARILRIFPGLIAAVVVTAFVIGPLLTTLPLGSYFTHSTTYRYLFTIDLVHLDQPLAGVGFHYGYAVSVNTPLWTLPVELRMYLFLAVLGGAGALRSARWLSAAFVVAVLGAFRPTGTIFALLSYWGLSAFISGLLGATNNYPLFFLMGSLLYCFRGTIKMRSWIAIPMIVLWLASHYTTYTSVVSLLCLPYVILWAGVASTRGLRQVSRIGDLSYGLYIYAFPIEHVWMKYTGLDANGHGRLFALVFATTVPVAFASWHLVEKRALRLKSRA
jgi:peptidoglycan/LPS O-acetylase OafA/YrhL